MRDPIYLGDGCASRVSVTPTSMLVAIAPGQSGGGPRMLTFDRTGQGTGALVLPTFYYAALQPIVGRYLLRQAGATCALRDLTTGEERDLGPSYGMIAANDEYGAWQDMTKPTPKLHRIRWADLVVEDVPGDGCPMGLVYLHDDGSVVSWDNARYTPEWPGFLNPRPCHDLVYGTGPNGGVTIQRAGGPIRILAAGTVCMDPHMAYCNGLYAGTWWGQQSGGVRLQMLTADDIDALPLATPPPISEPIPAPQSGDIPPLTCWVGSYKDQALTLPANVTFAGANSLVRLRDKAIICTEVPGSDSNRWTTPAGHEWPGLYCYVDAPGPATVAEAREACRALCEQRLATIPADQPCLLICQMYGRNFTWTNEATLAALMIVYPQMAAAHANVKALLFFSGPERRDGTGDHPALIPWITAIAAAVVGEPEIDSPPPAPPTPPEPPVVTPPEPPPVVVPPVVVPPVVTPPAPTPAPKPKTGIAKWFAWE